MSDAASKSGSAAGRRLGADELDKLIAEVVAGYAPRSVGDDEIADGLAGVSVTKKERAMAYNRLLKRCRLELFHGGEGGVRYGHVDAQVARRIVGLDPAERQVYQCVRQAGEAGVTRKDVKFKTNIRSTGELSHIFTRLKGRALIKEITSVQGRGKVFILAGLDASVAHTGGPWYDDSGVYDQEFIGAMYGVVLSYIRKRAGVTAEDVAAYVVQCKVSKETLSAADLRTLINTMVYDGEVEVTKTKDGVERYRRIRPTPAVNQLASLPCGSCPVFKQCTPDGVISPTSCVYMDNWLKACADW